MLRLLIPLILFVTLIGWIFQATMRDRHGLDLRGFRAISWTVLAVELLVLGLMTARLPLLRTPLGFVIAFPVVMGGHYLVSAQIAKALEQRGWLKRSGRPRIITIKQTPPKRPRR